VQEYEHEIEKLKKHLIEQGYRPIACVDCFVRGRHDETLVVHFSQEGPKLLGEEHFEYFDTPGTVCTTLDLHTGKISIPELF